MNKGFTMLEIVLVIAVIAILNIVITPLINDMYNTTNKKTIQDTLISLKTKLEQRYLINDKYPKASNFEIPNNYNYETSNNQQSFELKYNKIIEGDYLFIDSESIEVKKINN